VSYQSVEEIGMEKQKILKKALLLFAAEFAVWLLAGIVIGKAKGSWDMMLKNQNFLLLAAVLSALSAFFDYTRKLPPKK